jgi:AcrR family transcriptional regulator
MTPRLVKPRTTHNLERLLDAAEELFGQEGFLHLTTDELAQRLHCSKRTLYEIGAGRDRIFETVLHRRTTRLEKSLFAQVDNAPDTEAALLASVEAIVAALEGMSPIYLRDIQIFPPAVKMVKGFQRQLAEAIARAIKRGEKEQLFRRIEPRVAAEALLASINRMIQPDFLATSSVTAAQAVRQVFQIFWGGLSRNQGVAPKGRSPRAQSKASAAAKDAVDA